MILRALALVLLVSAVAGVAPAPPRDPGKLARAILSDTSRYHLTQPQVRERPKTWLERAWDWIALQWSRLIRALVGKVRVPAKASTALGDAIVFFLVVFFVAALAKVLGSLGRRAPSRALATSVTELSDPHQLYRRSLTAAADHALTQALELLFAAAVATLDRRGLTHSDVSSTVGDFRRDIRTRDASLIEPFDAIADPFTAAVYAQRPPGEADWVRAHVAFLALWDRRDAA